MKTFTVLLSCYSGWHLLFMFFFGMLVTIIVGLIARAREQQIMKEKRDLLKLTHAIQRYYWLVKRGKSVEANKKALKKFISVFSNRVVYSSPSAVEYALNSFRIGVFDTMRTKISGVYDLYKSQFHQRTDFDMDETMKLVTPIQQENLISSEEAVNRIQKIFDDADVKGFYCILFKILGFLPEDFFTVKKPTVIKTVGFKFA